MAFESLCTRAGTGYRLVILKLDWINDMDHMRISGIYLGQ